MRRPEKCLTPFGGGVPISENDPHPLRAAPLPGCGEETPTPLEKIEREFEANPPPHPCVGCGYCCLKSQCYYSIHLFGDVDGVCQSLIYNGERYRCAQVGNPRLKYEVGIGTGCCSPLFNERRRRQIYTDQISGRTPSPLEEKATTPVTIRDTMVVLDREE